YVRGYGLFARVRGRAGRGGGGGVLVTAPADVFILLHRINPVSSAPVQARRDRPVMAAPAADDALGESARWLCYWFHHNVRRDRGRIAWGASRPARFSRDRLGWRAAAGDRDGRLDPRSNHQSLWRTDDRGTVPDHRDWRAAGFHSGVDVA